MVGTYLDILALPPSRPGQSPVRGVVLIALTGGSQEKNRRKSQKGGSDHHLTKSVDPTQLKKLLTSLPLLPGLGNDLTEIEPDRC
jgi:hypothetical protein